MIPFFKVWYLRFAMLVLVVTYVHGNSKGRWVDEWGIQHLHEDIISVFLLHKLLGEVLRLGE
jgi:hypothetical protein